MTLYAVHHAWIDDHAVKAPVGIWGEGGVSFYPPETEGYRKGGSQAETEASAMLWSHWVEKRTEWGSTYGASWSAIESDDSMEQVLTELRAEFFSDPHPSMKVMASVSVGYKEDSESSEEDSEAPKEDSVEVAPEPAERFMLAQTWWIASEFARMHSDWAIRYGDHLTYLTLVNPRDHDSRIACNPTAVHMFGPDSRQASVGHLLSTADPYEVVKALGDFVGDPSHLRTPASTPRTLAYRLLATVLTVTVNDRARWAIQNEVVGDDGYGEGSAQRGFVAQFSEAQQAARTLQSESWDLGEPLRHFWAILREDDPVAIVSTEGYVYRQDRQFDLPAEYQASGRRILPLVVAVLGDLLP